MRDRLTLEPMPTPVRIERRGRFAVARPVTSPVETLDEATVEETLRQLREERSGEAPP